MQDSYIIIPLLKGADEIISAPISVFASSDQEAFEKFLRKSIIGKNDWTQDSFQIFKLGNADSGWCLVPLNEEFLKYTIGTDAHDEAYSQVGNILGESEKNLILETLRMCGGKKARAAKILGISRRTIYRKLKEWE